MYVARRCLYMKRIQIVYLISNNFTIHEQPYYVTDINNSVKFDIFDNGLELGRIKFVRVILMTFDYVRY